MHVRFHPFGEDAVADREGAEELDEVLALGRAAVREVVGELGGDEGEVVRLRVAVLERLRHLLDHALLEHLQLHLLLLRVHCLRLALALCGAALGLSDAFAVGDAVHGAFLEFHDVLRERARLVREDVLDLPEVVGDVPGLWCARRIEWPVVHVHVL